MTLHCLAEDLLEAYAHIASDNGIGIEHVRDHLRHRGRSVPGSHHSQPSTSAHQDPPIVHSAVAQTMGFTDMLIGFGSSSSMPSHLHSPLHSPFMA